MESGKQTNADTIRNMSDEELAELLFNKSRCDNCFANCNDKANCPSLGSCYSRHIKMASIRSGIGENAELLESEE